MGDRLKKALQALGVVLVITVACLAFMPWQISDVIEPLSEADRCMILRYDQSYSTAYPDDDALERLITTMEDTTGHFDRKRSNIVYKGAQPLYRIYLWTPEGRISDIWMCGAAFFYDGTQYMLNDSDAAVLNRVLASCFS